MMRMTAHWTEKALFGKFFILLSLLFVAACSTNPATGEKQFTALLPAGQEAAVGAQEHAKVEDQFGKFMTGPVDTYVNQVANPVIAQTERSEVKYTVSVIDSPMVNAFALPGGYLYVTRGLMALANNEAELAGVLAHEAGHVTGRHAAERVSQGVLVGLGAAILSAATGSSAVSQAAGVGGDLLVKSYSRGQENEADSLGVRYLSRSGYDPKAMASFLTSLEAHTQLESKVSGKASNIPPYFSTHPLTADRIRLASAEANQYSAGTRDSNRTAYLRMLDGMIYGDSPDQGFVKGSTFYHPSIGFKFSVPSGCPIQNSPSAVVAQCADGSIIVFDAAGSKTSSDPYQFLTQVWLEGKQVQGAEKITINGMPAAAASTSGTINGQTMGIQLVAIEWKPGEFFRFQIAYPQGANAQTLDALKRTTYSFAKMSAQDKQNAQPMRIKIFTAGAGDTVSSVASRLPFDTYKEERFRVLNGLTGGQQLQAGQLYKTIVQ